MRRLLGTHRRPWALETLTFRSWTTTGNRGRCYCVCYCSSVGQSVARSEPRSTMPIPRYTNF